MSTSNGPWKPFLLGALSASLTYIAVLIWNSEDVPQCDGISFSESDEDSSVHSDANPIATEPSHSASPPNGGMQDFPSPNEKHVKKWNVGNDPLVRQHSTWWVNMIDISRILTENDSKKSRAHKFNRWKWESIRRKIRKKTSSSQRLLDDMVRFVRKHGLFRSPQSCNPTESVHPSNHGTVDDEEKDHRQVNLGGSSSDDDMLWNSNMYNTEKSGLCIGSIFGLDVGGTLAKLVYFEKHTIENSSYSQDHIRQENIARVGPDDTVSGKEPRRNIHAKIGSQDSHSNEDLTKLLRARQSSMPDALLRFHEDENAVGNIESIRKTQSMLNLVDGDDRAMVLSKFYNFANNLDSYASGVKEKDLSFYSRALGGDFHFIQFETSRMRAALELFRISSFHRNILHIGATGGGAHRFSNEFEQVLGIEIVKQDELESMVAGLQFALRDFPNECYTFLPDEDAMLKSESSSESLAGEVASSPEEREHSPTSTHQKRRLKDSDQYWWSKKVSRESASTAKQYPYLVIMIGTGVSILRVDGPRKHERISGSTIGGGTYWGLCRLLTDAEDFQSALELAKRGDATKVDMLVGDIYGPNSGALEKLGLSANIVASSFGKLVSKQNPADGLNQADLARALLLMVTNNIGQVALLNARLHNTQRIFFIGNFLRHNVISQQRLAFSLAFWSQGKMEALFLEHEGYFGSLGAFLLSQGINTNKLTASLSTHSRPESKSHRELKKSKRYRARSL